MQTLEYWLQLRTALAEMQAQEKDLRVKLFHGTFPQPKEGVNDWPLPDGRTIKGTHKINRSVITKEWDALSAARRKKLLDTGALILKPSLVLSGYRALEGEPLTLVETVLEIKPGLPDLEIKPAPEP